MKMRRILGFVVAFILINIDQASKLGVQSMLETRPDGLFLTSFLRFVEVQNRGISFGLFNNPDTQPKFMIGLTLAIVLGLVVWLCYAKRYLTIIGIGCVIGGAVGNIVDRWSQGYVYDFIDFHIGAYSWPAFNFADSMICLGAFLLMLDIGLGERHDVRKIDEMHKKDKKNLSKKRPA